MITGLYLAAGLGRRFGGDKLLHPIQGKPLFCYSLDQCLGSRLTDIRVLTGAPPSRLQDEIKKRYHGETRIKLVTNHDPARGMASSLRAGIRAVRGSCDGIMVLLADMPRVTAGIMDTLVEEFEKNPGIIIPECGGKLRHPRVIPEVLFEQFLQLGDGEKGATVIDRFRGMIVPVHTGNETNFIDIDSPDDVNSLDQI